MYMQRLDSARVKPESPQHPDTFHFSLSLTCFTHIKVSAEGDAQTEKREMRMMRQQQ